MYSFKTKNQSKISSDQLSFNIHHVICKIPKNQCLEKIIQNPDLTRRKKSEFSCFFGFFGYNGGEVYFDSSYNEPNALSICILSDQTF